MCQPQRAVRGPLLGPSIRRPEDTVDGELMDPPTTLAVSGHKFTAPEHP